MKLSGVETWTVAVTALCLAAMLVYFGMGRPSALLGETASPGEVPAAESAHPTRRVNINTADKELLMTLPGIGESRAREIIKYRRYNGPFRYVEDLLQVPGIGPGMLEGLLEYATVGG